MPQTILAIDIGSYSVKMARLERSFKAFQLTDFHERSVQYNDVLSREEAMLATARLLMEDHDLKGDYVVTALPGQMVSSRVIELPFGSRKKISQLIEFEIENHIPFAAEDVVLDYHVISSTKETSKIFVAYAQKSDLVKFLNICASVGVDPRWICVEGVEFLNLMHIGMVPPESVYAIIDIGHSKSTVSICQGKQFLYTRVVPIGGGRITDEIAKILQIPPAEAEKMKVEMGQAISEADEGELDPLSKRVTGAIRQVLDSLVLQIRQTFFSLQSTGSEPVSGIYLCGGTSRLPGIDHYISAFLKQNVTFLDVRDFHFVRPDRLYAHHAVVPMGVALALRSVAGAGLPEINFRRGEFVYKGDVAEFGGNLRRAAGIMVGLLMLGIFYFGIRHYTLQAKLDQFSSEAADIVKKGMPDVEGQSVATTAAALRLVKGKKDELAEKLQKMHKVFDLSILDILAEVSRIVPGRQEIRLDVDTFDITEAQIRISGRTDSFETVDKIKMAVEKSALFENATTGNVRKGVADEIKFDLSFKLSPTAAPPSSMEGS